MRDEWGRPYIVSLLGGGIAVALVSLGCANITKFDEPYTHETFMGALNITPALEGVDASGFATAAVTIVGNESGQTVTIYGLPKNEPFALVPTNSIIDPLPASVSGVIANVVDGGTLEITGFASMSAKAKRLQLTVSGVLVRQGPRISTKEPILISANAGMLKDLIPESIRPQIKRKSDQSTIDAIPDREMIPIYEIRFRGDALSVL